MTTTSNNVQEMNMNEQIESNTFCCGPEIYEIRVQGHLQDRWTERFELTHSVMKRSLEQDSAANAGQ